MRTVLIILMVGLLALFSAPLVSADHGDTMGQHMGMAGQVDCTDCADMPHEAMHDALSCLHGLQCLPHAIIEAPVQSLAHSAYSVRYPRPSDLPWHSRNRSLDVPPPRLLSVSS